MYKKLLFQLLIFVILALLWFELPPLYQTLTTAKISGPLPVFPQIQIKLLKSPHPELKGDALTLMQKSLLQYFAPDLSTEDCQMQYTFVSLSEETPDSSQDLVVALSLSQKRGILIILRQQNKSYVLVSYRDNLWPLLELTGLEGRDNWEIFLTKEYREDVCRLKFWGWEKNNLRVLRREEFSCP